MDDFVWENYKFADEKLERMVLQSMIEYIWTDDSPANERMVHPDENYNSHRMNRLALNKRMNRVFSSDGSHHYHAVSNNERYGHVSRYDGTIPKI
jgi:hypothetical protein